MTWTTQDYQFMSEAIRLARRGDYTCDPNPCVGCVITKENQALARGWHTTTGKAHAEINALKACDNVAGVTVYLTLEPCSHQGRTPPCVEALIKAQVKEVIVAMPDPNPLVYGTGIKQLETAGIQVRSGLLEIEASKLNPGFIKRMLHGMPYIRCKMAMSLDGGTALANGESQWISAKGSRRDVHRLRAASSAILTTVETIIKDDPLLTARDLDFAFKQPIRIIVDRQLKTPTSAKLFSVTGKVIIYTEHHNNKRLHELERIGAEVISLPASETWLADIFFDLAKAHQVNDVMVEAGATFSGLLMDADLVDEVIIYMALILLGQDARPLFRLKPIGSLSAAKRFAISDLRRIGEDIRFILTPEKDR